MNHRLSVSPLMLLLSSWASDCGKGDRLYGSGVSLTLVSSCWYNSPIMPSSARHMPARPSFFIVLEGIDGSGKSTQARLLAEWYRDACGETLLTREPGGTSLGESLRALILNPDVACATRAELMLILAARAQLVAETIRPALAAGVTVISDRFSPSSLAFQGGGRGLPLAEIRAADAVARGGLWPNLILLIDVPLEVALDRLLARADRRADRFEGEGRAFQERVRHTYLALAETDPTIRIIDGTGSIEEIQATVRQAVRDLVRTHATEEDTP